MAKRLTYVTHLLTSLHDSSPQTAADAEQVVTEGITGLAKDLGIKRTIVRRDAVRQNGYTGPGAQTKLAHDLFAALKGDPTSLLDHLRSGDAPIVKGHLNSLSPKPTSAEWLEQQVRDQQLDRRLAFLLRRDHPSEEMEECLSIAGLWIAKWAYQGTFDKVLAEKGTVPFSTLYRFLKRKHYSSIFVRGSEPLARMRGLRTQHEIRVRHEEEHDDFICHAANMGTEWQTALEGEENDRIEVIISPDPSPEEMCYLSEIKEAGRHLVRAGNRGAADRYERVYDQLVAGLDRTKIRDNEGVSDTRSSHLVSTVRSTLRVGGITMKHASAIFDLVSMEPWSTRTEIEQDLGIDAPSAKRAIAFLVEQDILEVCPHSDEGKLHSYAVKNR